MTQNQFSVLYNGHPVAVSALENNTYLVQITYKPVTIQCQTNEKGEETWLDAQSQQETYMSAELGKLISNYLVSSEASN